MSGRSRPFALSTCLALCGWFCGCPSTTEQAPSDAGADLDQEVEDQAELPEIDVTPDAACEQECTSLSSRRCYPGTSDMYQICEIDDDGCMRWSMPQACPGGQSCSAGFCSPICYSDPGCVNAQSFRCTGLDTIQECEEREAECYQFGEEQDCPEFMLCDSVSGCQCDNDCTMAGDTRCFSTTQVQTCQQTASGCLIWSTPSTCPNQASCTSGACETVCVSDPGCTEADIDACYSPNEVVTCVEVETGCYQWSAPERCPGSLVCNEGECEVTCTSDPGCTEAGLIGCWDDGHQRTCQEVQTGCFKWSAPVACADHQACTAGVGCECDDECSQGQTECVSESDRPLLRECTEDANECLYWSYRYCGSTEACEGGECVEVCVSDPGCTAAGLTQCHSSSAQSTCEEVEDGCFQWGEAVACPEHQSCQTDSCQCVQATGCTAADVRRCDDATHYSVCQLDGAGCLYWTASTECPANQTCSSGICSSTCVSDPGCTGAGVLRCNDEGQVQQCQQIQPGCFKWGTPSGCPEHQVCSGSSGCVCDDACDAAGDAYCSATGLLMTCTEDASDCLFNQPSECPEGDSCVVDECIPVESPVLDCGEVTFNVVDHGYLAVHVAGDFNDWSPTALPLVLSAGIWSASVSLDLPGIYQYKLIIDGVWLLDPLNPETTGSGYYTNNIVTVPVVENCETADATRCAVDGALEECTDVSGCLTWLLGEPACLADNTYCADATCHIITSPVITATEITFTVRDQGYAGLDVAGDFTDPAWGVFIPLTEGENHWSTTLQQASYPGLTVGDHQYKYRTSTNVWFYDPSNDRTVDDGHSGLNSVFTIGCLSECSGAGATGCVSETESGLCELDEDGCLYWTPTDCPSAPQEYCLTDSCQLFPIVNSTSDTVTFYYPFGDQTRARVRGTFSEPDWSEAGAVEMIHTGDYWVGTLDTASLAAGQYWYKFCLNNCGDPDWVPDPYNNDCETTGDRNCPFTLP